MAIVKIGDVGKGDVYVDGAVCKYMLSYRFGSCVIQSDFLLWFEFLSVLFHIRCFALKLL